MQNNRPLSSTNVISFMGANYVARQVGYHMTGGWGEGDRATNAYFQPLETFAQRFEELLQDVRAMGFTALDIWNAQLNWAWATPEHLRIAQQLLEKYQLPVTSLAGFFGRTPQELDAACRVAVAVGTTILGGLTSLLQTDRLAAIAILKQYGVRLGIENHPEKNPQEILAKIGDGGDGTIGTAIDTGWYGTQGYSAVKAIEELFPHIVLVHLKDVRAPGAHETCRYGQGIVDIAGCVSALKRLGYTGSYSIEHEPELFDPTEDCKAMLVMLREWLA